MNIKGIQNKPLKKESPIRSRESSDISFSSLLAGQIQAPVESKETTAPVSVQNNSLLSAATRTDGIALTEKTIDFLASYAEALENLQLKTEEMAPLIEALEDGTTSLLDIKAQLDADDPLAQLLDRVAAVAYLESEKFRRGDYDS